MLMDKNKYLYIVLAVVVLFTAGQLFYLFVFRNGIAPGKTESEKASVSLHQEQQTNRAQQNANTVPTAQQTVMEVPFDYEVTVVSADEAVLVGEKGDLTISNSPIVQVYQGTKENNVPASFADLSVGQKIQLKAIPGESIWVYILP